MKKPAVIRTILCTMLALSVLTITIPASATCRTIEIDAIPFTWATTNTGTANDDIILCRPYNAATGTVRGLGGSDTILIYAAFDPGVHDIIGGDTAIPGNDQITIFDDASVRDVSGDRDTTGGLNSGDDMIIVHGSARNVYGDDVRTVTVTGTTGGGDDIIDITGTVANVYGDGITASSNTVYQGGDDVITIYEGATVSNAVIGDVLNANNISSSGGDDIITIHGTVFSVLGDHVLAGFGGHDTIFVSASGQVGTSGTSSAIYGDSFINSTPATYGASDEILVEGRVYGHIFGDYMQFQGASDDIIVGETGIVTGSIYGDYVFQNTGINGFDTIIILGNVNQNVEGDGYRGHGKNDSINITGTVGGDVVGDGTSRTSGNANGGADEIIVNGTIAGKLLGDDVDGNGGDDNIQVLSNGLVDGGVFGDNATRSGGNGGDDTILVDGHVGLNSAPESVYGDKVGGNGGDDFIHILSNGLVYGSVIGDDVNGEGGEDLIWIDGTVNRKVVGDSASNGNKKDRIAVRQSGVVGLDVVGDGSSSNNPGGWDTLNIIGGQVGRDFIGDDIGGNAKGGNDFMAIRMSGVVGRDFIGDMTNNGAGGNDTMSLINGTVNGDMIGDDAGGNGGDDKLNVLVAGTVKGDLIGDKVGADKVGGDDNIFVSGKVNGRIYGDHPTKNAFAGADNIQTSPSAVIGNGIYGDNAKGAGKNDSIKVNGKVNAGGVRGDVVNGKGGNDTISIFSLGDVKGNVVGDDANGAGGNDTILVDNNGKVTGNVWGDLSKNKGGNDTITIGGTVTGDVAGDRQKSNGTPNGGNDTIIVEATGLVQGNVYGDDVPGNGGDDKIDIRGRVNGNVLGDKVGGTGGNDVIRIFASATVGGNVCGKNNCNNNPGDNVVFLDESTTPTLDSADTIIIAGKVLGNVIAGVTNGNSDDTVVVVEGAEIGGTVYAGDETDGDSFIYIENIINEEKTVSEVVNSVKEHDGKVTVNGATYTLDDVEVVSGAVGQISCFGMDYRMNKASDGCAARSGAEKDAIQWHLDNPGNDGRLPGLEGCAVYPYGDALRVYEIMNGEQGALVAEIWGDVLSNAPTTNELLGSTADGNVALYHLASGELQIECRNFVDGKTQVRVLSDLAGTVTNAYDKG